MSTKKKSREELQWLRDEALDAYLNREDFHFEVNADALYQRYKDQYTEQGEKAMQDAMGRAAALTGGYGSSYAQSVGQKAYQGYLEQMGDVVPALYQLAYERYQDKGNRLYKTYQTWAEMEQQAAQQEQWEREHELEQRKLQEAYRQSLLEDQPQNQEIVVEPEYDNGSVSEGNIKTMQRLLGLPDTGKWTDLEQQYAGDLSADKAWKDYQQGKLQSRSRSGMSVKKWTELQKAQEANTPVTMTKTQQTEQFVDNTDSWETVSRSGNGYENYEEYLTTRIDTALSKGQLTSGEAAWLISYYTPDIGENTNDQYTSDRFKQLQKQVMAQLAADVDERYIETFLVDVREFVFQTEADIKNLSWATATSDKALNERNTSAQAIKDRANKVRAWLDANKSRITQDSYQQYIQYLDEVFAFLDQTADVYRRKKTEFSRFESQEKYDQAVQAYEQDQEYRNKYTGMTANQLTATAVSLPEGKEKNWVLSYAAQTPKTKEELQQDLVWLQGQYQYLIRLQNEGTELAAIKSQLEATTPDAPGYAELKKQYEDRLKQYPSMRIFDDLDGQIAAVEQTIWELKRDEKYNYVNENEDFDTYSRYVSTKSDGWWDKLSSQYGMGYDDLKYEYINGAANGMRSEITEKSTTWDGTITHQFGIYDHMKPDEISIYNYYYAKHGKEQAEEYLASIAGTLEARSDSVAIQRAMEIASEHKVLSSALSIWGNLGSGVEYIADIVDYGIEKIKGNPYARLGSNQAALMSNTIRSTVAEQVDWEIGNWDAFDFLYNTAMSGADSIVASTLFGKYGGIALGLSAAAQGTNDALSRGMSDGQAFWSGLFSGVFEGLFETVSIGQFSSLKEVAPESLKDIFKNLGKSMLVNASEETLTEIANIGYDTLVNGKFAHYTLEELKSGAWKDALWQVLESGASGLLIGAGMSMVGSTYSYGNQQAQNYQTGKNILNTDGGVDALLNSADQVRSVSSPQMQKALIEKVSQNPTARNVGQMNATVQAASSQVNTTTNQANTVATQEEVAKSLRSKGVYSKEVVGIAEAIVARLNGQDLTRRQRSTLSFALNTSAVRDTISEFINRKKTATEQPRSGQGYQNFPEATVQPEQHMRLEKDGFAWEHEESAKKAAGKKGRTQNETLANQSNDAKMNLGEMYSEAHESRKNFKFLSDERFEALTIEVRKKGAVIVRGTPEVERHLDMQGASAAALGDVLLFRKDVCLSEVLEETHHFNQNLIGLNNDKKEPLRTILNEIDAKEYIIRVAQKYQVPRNELEHIKKQLESYRRQLENYKKGG